MIKTKNLKIGVIGLGYVGLPLAVEFGKKFKTIGFDINKSRIKSLNFGVDHTKEISNLELSSSRFLTITDNLHEIARCNFYIVTVPTPIYENKKPNLSLLEKASTIIGKLLKKGDYVIYESTVYPGATEEVCLPILKKNSNLIFNKDFFIGYSPERINPGDKLHKIVDIKKITSGSTVSAAKFIDFVYKKIIKAGTYMAKSIMIAEAAKVIENTQRDLNIALINELAIIFDKMNLDTEEVLKAAGTKWNFLPFRPGLVGGHCIGVDPYYLTYKSEKMGYKPKIILSGRHLNDNMSDYITKRLVLKMNEKKIKIKGAKVLIMGLTFKENCPDIRNSKIFDLIKKLKKYKVSTSVFDPWVDKNNIKSLNNINLIQKPKKNNFDCVIVAVSHKIFAQMGIKKIKNLAKKKHIIYDLKYLFPKNSADLRL